MKTFNDYMNAAIKRQQLTSNNKLAQELGITSASISVLNQGKALPSEATMIRLAELAGMPKEEALIDLNLWRSKGNPEINKIWQRVAKMIGIVFAVLVFSSFRVSACNIVQKITNISQNIDTIVYIMRQNGVEVRGENID